MSYLYQQYSWVMEFALKWSDLRFSCPTVAAVCFVAVGGQWAKWIVDHFTGHIPNQMALKFSNEMGFQKYHEPFPYSAVLMVIT